MSYKVLDLPPEQLKGENVAVLSDVHANYEALQSALNLVNSKQVTTVIILGDLLTYGCQGDKVLKLLKELERSKRCFFILGNHEEFYFKLQAGEANFSYQLPDFIAESVNFNYKQLEVDLNTYFDWYDVITVGPLYFSHANPYGGRDWTYLNTDEECVNAVSVLQNKGYQVGFFGHTHRKKWFVRGDKASPDLTSAKVKLDGSNDSIVVNPGSVGQPRGEGASFIIFRMTDKTLELEFMNIEADMTSYVSDIREAKLSRKTTEKLLSYIGDKSD